VAEIIAGVPRFEDQGTPVEPLFELRYSIEEAERIVAAPLVLPKAA
jgi:hypothetical protein